MLGPMISQTYWALSKGLNSDLGGWLSSARLFFVHRTPDLDISLASLGILNRRFKRFVMDLFDEPLNSVGGTISSYRCLKLIVSAGFLEDLRLGKNVLDIPRDACPNDKQSVVLGMINDRDKRVSSKNQHEVISGTPNLTDFPRISLDSKKMQSRKDQFCCPEGIRENVPRTMGRMGKGMAFGINPVLDRTADNW